MPLPDLTERDRAEVERSLAEAAKVVLNKIEVERYLNPPSNTPYALEYAFHLLGDVKGKVVLDLGCGTGENLIPLLKRGAHIIAIDISPELVEIARQRLPSYGFANSGAMLQVGSAYQTGLASESIDVVFSMALLHHLDLETAGSEIYRILKPGGLLILREPTRFSGTMNFLRKLFPSPEADVSDFEHPMTREELAVVEKRFTVLADRSFRLPFIPLLGGNKRINGRIWQVDRWLLSHFPGLEHFATCKVMSLQRPLPEAHESKAV